MDINTGHISRLVNMEEGVNHGQSRENALDRPGPSPRETLFIARTDYTLAAYSTAAHGAGPQWNITYSRISGLSDPFSRLQASPMATVDDQLFYSSADKVVVVIDRKTGEIQWAREFPSIVNAFFAIVEPRDLDAGDFVSPVLSPLPIAPSMAASRIYQNRLLSEQEAPIYVLDLNGVLFTLPSLLFPKASREHDVLSLQSVNSIVIGPSDEFLMHLKNDGLLFEECSIDSASYPDCLVGPRVSTLLYPVPLLPDANNPLEDHSVFKLIATITLLLVGLLIIWRRTIKSRTIAFPTSAAAARDGADVPPGFEEVTIHSANIFYQHQSNENVSEYSSHPKSFLVSNEILGYGSHGTVVFKGLFDGRTVAIKRMLADFYQISSHEVELLQHSDSHPNIVRYFCREQTEKFTFIVLELCVCSVADLIEFPERVADASMTDMFCKKTHMETLREISEGLAHLHNINLVHRDIKPHNILITPQRKFVISDFGLSKRLIEGQSSFDPTYQGGTVGWRAPECLASTQGDGHQKALSKSVDVFSLGCLYYYILTGGKHPFGDRLSREQNIANGAFNIEEILSTFPEAHELVARMIALNPRDRPSLMDILNHPLFWPAQKRLNFLLDVSDRFEFEDRKDYSELLFQYEKHKGAVFGQYGSWNRAIHHQLWADICQHRKYVPFSLRDLLRALRNKRNHFHELSLELRALIGSTPEDFLNYFLSRFPRLLVETYVFVADSSLRAESPFSELYFDSKCQANL